MLLDPVDPNSTKVKLLRVWDKTKTFVARYQAVLEFAAYSLFLALLTLSATLTYPGESLHLHNDALTRAFADIPPYMSGGTSLHSIDTVTEFWNFVDDVILRNVLPDGNTVAGEGFFQRHVRILGQVKFRQIRVRNDTCSIPPEVQTYVKSCFSEFTAESEDQQTIQGLPDGGVWQEGEPGAGTFEGPSGIRYPASGFTAKSSSTHGAFKQLKELLQARGWLDSKSRAVFIDLLAYNPNINTISTIKIAVEFPVSGGALPILLIRSMPLGDLLADSRFNGSLASMSIVLSLLLIAIVFHAGLIRDQKMSWAKRPFNWLDMVIAALFIASFVFRLQPVQTFPKSSFPPGPSEFLDLEPQIRAASQFYNLFAVCVVMAWLRLLKFMSLVPFMGRLHRMMSRAFAPIFIWLVIVVVVLFGFSVAHMLAYGSKVDGFGTLRDSMFSLLRALLGDFNLDELTSQNRVLGALFFVSWVLFVFLIFMNVFTAILVESLYLTRKDGTADATVKQTFANIWEGFKSRMPRINNPFKRDEVVVGPGDAVVDVNEDGALNEFALAFKAVAERSKEGAAEQDDDNGVSAAGEGNEIQDSDNRATVLRKKAQQSWRASSADVTSSLATAGQLEALEGSVANMVDTLGKLSGVVARAIHESEMGAAASAGGGGPGGFRAMGERAGSSMQAHTPGMVQQSHSSGPMGVSRPGMQLPSAR